MVIFKSMITISKSTLKAKMLEYFRHLEETGEEIVVTSHGKPIAKVTPYSPKRAPETVFADLRGKVIYHDDLLAPETEEWEET